MIPLVKTIKYILAIGLILFFPESGEAKAANSIMLTIKTSPNAEYFYEQSVTDDPALVRSILRSKEVSSSEVPELPRAYLTIKRGDIRLEYVIDETIRLFGEKHSTMLDLPPETVQKLKRYIQTAEISFYGEPVHWNQVQQLFPKNSNAQVLDLETGLTFQVQRRAGSKHADVQPLTREDSRIMKTIYNGKWSWKRRAILVKIGDRQIAASMNGMPHGAGAIKGNDFPGHFCIHFEGSTTHKMRKQDPGHLLMIRKASGLLNQEIVQSSPEQLAELFMAAIKSQDLQTAKRMLKHSDRKGIQEFMEKAGDIDELQINKKPARLDTHESGENQALQVEVPMRVSVYRTSSRNKRQLDLNILVKRDSLQERWRIEADSVSPLWNPDDKKKP